MGQALITRRGVPMLAPDVDDGYEQLINYTMLYDSGDECEEVTGGFSDKTVLSGSWGKATLSEEESQVILTASSATKLLEYGSENKIDVGEYSKMYAEYDFTVGTSGLYDTYARFAIKESYSGGSSPESSCLKYVQHTESGTYLDSIDVSDLSDSYYVSLTMIAYKYTSTIVGRNIFAVKPDNIATLCTKAGITAPTDLVTLIADTTSLATIFNNEDAVKFMVAQCTGDFMVSVLSNEAAVEALKESPYLNLVIANPHWAKFMMMIPTAKSVLGFTMLYDHGDECTDVTGGLTFDYTYGNSQVTATEKNSDHVKISVNGSSSGSAVAMLTTNNKIDLAGYNKLCAKGKNERTSGSTTNIVEAALRLKAAHGDGTGNSIPAIGTFGVFDGLLNPLDLSDQNGASYVSYSVGVSGSSSTKTYADFYLYVMWLTKADDWETWMSKGGVTGFSDMATLLADSTAMAKLMSNEQAVKYLVGCTGDLMVSILNSATAVGAIVNSAYATEMLTSHPVWAKFIKMSPVCADAGLDLLV